MRDFLANQVRASEVKGFKFALHDKNPLAVDLLQKLLVFDPRRRATVQEVRSGEFPNLQFSNVMRTCCVTLIKPQSYRFRK